MAGWRHLLAFVFLVLALQAQPVGAASITGKSNPNCAVLIRGLLGSGDFAKFLEVSKQHFPGSDGESTYRNSVCLDSPGGSLTEGVKFARYFYKEGVGTVIDAGQKCLSACAIMFMMGTARGDEVSFANRKLHVNGRLGFHRPYIRANDSIEASPDTLSASYDRAYQSALDLIAMANMKAPWTNSAMIKSDLLQAMLDHVGDAIFYIDTVDKAGRWDIDLIGYPEPRLLSEEQAFYACENALNWQVGLNAEDITYTAAIGEPVPGYRRVKPVASLDGTPAFQVEGLASGYVYEGCVISVHYDYLQGCGVDQNTNVVLGKGECDQTNHHDRRVTMSKMTALNPKTPIASLALGAQPAGATGLRCTVSAPDGIKIDDDPCTVSEFRNGRVVPRGATRVRHFLWPSGAKTVLVEFGNRVELNGVATLAETDPTLGQCFDNRASGNRFCFLEP